MRLINLVQQLLMSSPKGIDNWLCMFGSCPLIFHSSKQPFVLLAHTFYFSYIFLSSVYSLCALDHLPLVFFCCVRVMYQRETGSIALDRWYPLGEIWKTCSKNTRDKFKRQYAKHVSTRPGPKRTAMIIWTKKTLAFYSVVIMLCVSGGEIW